MNFRVNDDGTATLMEGANEFRVHPVKVRASTACPCGRWIPRGTAAYHEKGPAEGRRWLGGTKICAKCVRGDQ